MKIDCDQNTTVKYNIQSFDRGNQTIKMNNVIKSVILSLLISSCTSEITNIGDNEKQRNLNHINEISGVSSSIRSNFGAPNLQNFVGFSYSRASITGPKTRFINFRERVGSSYIVHLIFESFKFKELKFIS